MKRTSSPVNRLVVLLSVLLTLTFPLAAQPSPESGNPDRPEQRRPFAGGDRPGGRFQPGGGPAGLLFPMMERVLTEEQRQSLRTAMDGQREQMRPIEGKLREARRELMKAGMIEKFDEDSIRAKALEVGKLDAELTVLRAKAFAQMKPALSAEQIEQLRNPPPFEGGEGRPGNPRRPDRGPTGPRDENDLPAKPK